jgi:hypothetical protein
VSLPRPREKEGAVLIGDHCNCRFEGSSVAVYGAVNSNRGMYRVIIDGVTQEYVPLSPYSILCDR